MIGALDEQTRRHVRPVYSFDRSVYERSARKRRAFGLDLSIALNPDGGVAAPPATPLSLVTSVTCDRYFQSDFGVTSGATTTAWADQSGNAKHATGTARAKLSSALGGKPGVRFNGTSDVLTSAFSLAAPSVYYWGVCRVDTFAGANPRLVAGDSNNSALFMSTTSPNLSAYNGGGALAPDNNGMTVGGFFRFSNAMTNSAADALKVKGVTTTGQNIGNSGQSTITLGAGFSTFAAVTWVALGIWLGIPTSGERTALDTFAASYWAAGLTS